MTAQMLFWSSISATVLVLYMILKALKEPHPVLKTLKSIFFGTVYMVILNYIGYFFGITMPLNAANLCAAGILGIPGVCLTVILNAVF